MQRTQEDQEEKEEEVVDWRFGRVGVVLACEEHSASDLIRVGVAAEEYGFGFCFVSDHFHPWNFQQGHASYVWPVLGALAVQTHKMGLLSAVTCPVLRIHPTTLAQAASTVYHLSNGRFLLGLGTGERLNEQIGGHDFPPYPERLARLDESLRMTRQLLGGDEVSEEGVYFSVDRAQLFDPARDLPIFVAASGTKSAKFASDSADGLLCLGARPELADVFDRSGRAGRPKLTQLSVCWGKTDTEAVEMAHRYFPQVALDGAQFAHLATPSECEKAASKITLQDIDASIVCGPDPERYRVAIRECFDAGFDGVALHQIGPDQKGFFDWWSRELKSCFTD